MPKVQASQWDTARTEKKRRYSVNFLYESPNSAWYLRTTRIPRANRRSFSNLSMRMVRRRPKPEPGDKKSRGKVLAKSITNQLLMYRIAIKRFWRTHLGPYLVSMGYAIKNCMNISIMKKALVMMLKIPIQEVTSPSKKPASKGVKMATRISSTAQMVSHFQSGRLLSGCITQDSLGIPVFLSYPMLDATDGRVSRWPLAIYIGMKNYLKAWKHTGSSSLGKGGPNDIHKVCDRNSSFVIEILVYHHQPKTSCIWPRPFPPQFLYEILYNCCKYCWGYHLSLSIPICYILILIHCEPSDCKFYSEIPTCRHSWQFRGSFASSAPNRHSLGSTFGMLHRTWKTTFFDSRLYQLHLPLCCFVLVRSSTPRVRLS